MATAQRALGQARLRVSSFYIRKHPEKAWEFSFTMAGTAHIRACSRSLKPSIKAQA
jgi:hypothetical protein